MSGTFYITGLRFCPCPEECTAWSKELGIKGLRVVCLPKEDQLSGEEYKRLDAWDLLWRRFWIFLSARGVRPRRADRKRVQRAFLQAHKHRLEGGSRPPGWCMRGYTFSPTIVFVDLEGIPWSIGGKESFRTLFESYGESTGFA